MTLPKTLININYQFIFMIIVPALARVYNNYRNNTKSGQYALLDIEELVELLPVIENHKTDSHIVLGGSYNNVHLPSQNKNPPTGI